MHDKQIVWCFWEVQSPLEHTDAFSQQLFYGKLGRKALMSEGQIKCGNRSMKLIFINCQNGPAKLANFPAFSGDESLNLGAREGKEGFVSVHQNQNINPVWADCL